MLLAGSSAYLSMGVPSTLDGVLLSLKGLGSHFEEDC